MGICVKTARGGNLEPRYNIALQDDALREWIVSPRVNRSSVGDDDQALIEPG